MDKPENSVLLNVCLLPSSEVSDTCVELSEILKSDETLFVLGDDKFAHLTIYMARFAQSEVGTVVQKIEQSLNGVKSFTCEQSGYFLTAGGYVEVSYKRSSDLLSLHSQVIQSVSASRINPANPYEESYFAPYTEQQLQNAQSTGYDLAYDLYRPHITLTRFKAGAIPSVVPPLPGSNLSFEAKKICVYKADDNGAVYELVKEFSIS